MNITDLFVYASLPIYPRFAKNEWLTVSSKRGMIDMNISFAKIESPLNQLVSAFKNDHNAIGYVYVVNELYRNGIKVVKPTFEQCLAFENIEINIPFKDYKQPYETMCVEFPDAYKSLLESRFHRKPPLAVTCHRPNNKEYMIGGVSFGIKNYSITFFITNDESKIEEMIKWNENDDPDFQPLRHAERVALNVMLFMTNFGHTKIGYSNIKQHRHYERKEPLKAKQDFFYVGLNQEIPLFKKVVLPFIETNGIKAHSSPHPHWRRGHWKLQHHGPNNSLTKTIFIAAVFVCSENYKGNLSDTEVVYK